MRTGTGTLEHSAKVPDEAPELEDPPEVPREPKGHMDTLYQAEDGLTKV